MYIAKESIRMLLIMLIRFFYNLFFSTSVFFIIFTAMDYANWEYYIVILSIIINSSIVLTSPITSLAIKHLPVKFFVNLLVLLQLLLYLAFYWITSLLPFNHTASLIIICLIFLVHTLELAAFDKSIPEFFSKKIKDQAVVVNRLFFSVTFVLSPLLAVLFINNFGNSIFAYTAFFCFIFFLSIYLIVDSKKNSCHMEQASFSKIKFTKSNVYELIICAVVTILWMNYLNTLAIPFFTHRFSEGEISIFISLAAVGAIIANILLFKLVQLDYLRLLNRFSFLASIVILMLILYLGDNKLLLNCLFFLAGMFHHLSYGFAQVRSQNILPPDKLGGLFILRNAIGGILSILMYLIILISPQNIQIMTAVTFSLISLLLVSGLFYSIHLQKKYPGKN
jgi:hypothetical protein